MLRYHYIFLIEKKNQKDLDDCWHSNPLWKSVLGTFWRNVIRCTWLIWVYFSETEYSQNTIIQPEYVYFWPKTLHFRTHHWRNSITDISMDYAEKPLFTRGKHVHTMHSVEFWPPSNLKWHYQLKQLGFIFKYYVCTPS